MAVRVRVSKFGKTRWFVGLVVWSFALATAYYAAMAWDYKAGLGSAGLPKREMAIQKPLLIVVLHSQCPCSLATIENLINLPETDRSQLKIRLVFTGPNQSDSKVNEESEVLAGVDREYLTESQVLSRYGARTSGQAYLYSRGGDLIFSGGLTDSRGIQGDSAGLLAIRETVAGRKCIAKAPVYGCVLQTPKRLL